MLFSIKSKRTFYFSRISNILDIGIFVVFAFRIYMEYEYYRNDLDDGEYINSDDEYFNNIFILRNDRNLLDVVYC